MLPTRKLLFECPRSTGARARVRGETRRASRVLPLFGRPKIAAHSSVSLPRVYDAQRKCGAKVLFLYLFFCSFYHFPDWDRCVYGAKASSGFCGRLARFPPSPMEVFIQLLSPLFLYFLLVFPNLLLCRINSGRPYRPKGGFAQ